MRVFSLLSSAVPEQVKMLGQKLDAEAQSGILEIDIDLWILEAFHRWGLRYTQFAIAEGQLLDISRLKDNFVINVNLLLQGFKPQCCGVGFPVSILYNDSHGAKPGDLISAGVRYKQGIHEDHLVADEVEGKAMLSLHCVAEELSTGECNTEVRVITHHRPGIR